MARKSKHTRPRTAKSALVAETDFPDFDPSALPAGWPKPLDRRQHWQLWVEATLLSVAHSTVMLSAGRYRVRARSAEAGKGAPIGLYPICVQA